MYARSCKVPARNSRRGGSGLPKQTFCLFVPSEAVEQFGGQQACLQTDITDFTRHARGPHWPIHTSTVQK